MEPEQKGPSGDSERGSSFAVPGPPGGGPGPSVGAVDLDAAAVSRQFWLSHMRIGFAVFLAEGLAVVGYLLMTPSGPHRPVLWATTGLWIAFGAANLSGTGWVAAKAWRSTFSLGWTVLSALAVGGVVALDGGLGSPLIYLLFLPISYAAWAFSPVGSAVCGGTTVATAGVLGLADRNQGVHPGQALMLFAVLAGTGALATSAARNRARREAREARLVDQIIWLASTDTLTGCVVRRVFHERLQAEVGGCARHHRDLSLLMIDVDQFKTVNDTFGHLVGDQVLAQVGAVLRSQARGEDLVARLGGDEFGVLLPDTDQSAALAAAERMRAELQRHTDPLVTVSIGVGGLNHATPSTEQLLDDADLALYQSKHRGRDSVSVCAPAVIVPRPGPTLR